MTSLLTLARWLAGEFDNQAQAREQPVWFVHLRLWQRPLPQRIEGKLAFFLEQANALYPDRPYRQRILLLHQTPAGELQAQYLALKQPGQFSGAGANSDRLRTLSLADLDWLPGCVLTITGEAGGFVAQPPPDARCYFHYDGAIRQVVLGFTVMGDRFLSYDRGVDPNTGQALWGAMMGAYEFTKCQDFSMELPLEEAAS